MAYYDLQMIKKNLEVLLVDTSIDDTLDLFGAEADAWVNSIMGLGVDMSPIPRIIREISSNYAAGRYLGRIKEDPRGKELIALAERQLNQYINGSGHVVVFG